VKRKEDHSDIIRTIGGFINDNTAFDRKYIEELDILISHTQDNQLISSFIEYCAESNGNMQSTFSMHIIDMLSDLSDSKRDMLIDEILRKKPINNLLKQYIKLITDEIKERKEKTLLGRLKKICFK
jgi:lipopolysaccharide biosynthesis regulator YciM